MKVVLALLVTGLGFLTQPVYSQSKLEISVYAGPKMAMCTEVLTLRRAKSVFRELIDRARADGRLKAPAIFFSDSLVTGLQRSIFAKSPVKIEIGASNKPLCRDCIYVDLESEQLTLTQKSLHLSNKVARERFIQADIRRLPFDDHSVDIVLARNFPWFDPDPETLSLVDEAFTEIYRVLKDNGMFLIIGNEGFEKVRSGHDAFVRPYLKENDPGIFIREIETHEKDLEGFLFSPVRYEEAFLTGYSHLAKAAESHGLQPLWFRTPNYDGLLITRVQK